MAVGVTHAVIDPSTHAISLTCPPSNHFTLSVSLPSGGAGGVTSSPAGINCTQGGSGPTAVCSYAFEAGASVGLYQSAPTSRIGPGGYRVNGSRFAGWGGACTVNVNGTCSVTMNSAQAVTAAFVDRVVLQVTVDEPRPQGPYRGAHVAFTNTIRDPCITIGGPFNCWYEFDKGTGTLGLEARTDGGNGVAVFDHWAGCDNTDTTLAFCTLNGPFNTDRAVTATYSK